MNRSQYELYHYGVKGMKWGVRRKRESKDRYTPSERITLTGKIKSGKTITAKQLEEPKIANFLAKHNLKMRKQVEATKNMDLFDDKGSKIGNMQLFHESPTSLNVVWITVNNKQRGRGYAQTAMKMAEDYARKSGANQMTLEVPGDSPDARHIYEKQGFEVVGRISSEDDIWGGLTAMRKKLR